MRKARELRKSQYLPPEVIQKRQESALLDLINFASENVPYYRDLLKHRRIKSPGDIPSIPFLTKSIIQEKRQYLKAENIRPERFVSDATGGSTGEKLKFFADRNSLRAAFVNRANSWTGWDTGEKEAKLWGAFHDISKTQTLFERIKSNLLRRSLILSSYNMSEERMLEYIKKINTYEPELITGYASALNLLSDCIRENGIAVYSPRGIISSAETLYEDQRDLIESVFRCKVFNRYGCREVGDIAQECEEQNGLHIYAEHIFVEIVDENGRRCENGEMGEIAVTDLSNYVFPFIRYKIGDVGVLSDRICPCGRNLPMLERVEGRVWDVIVGPNGNRVVGALWHLFKNISGVRNYQVIQEKIDKMIVKLVLENEFEKPNRERIVKLLREKLGSEISVEIETVDSIPLTESGKRRYVISRVTPFKD